VGCAFCDDTGWRPIEQQGVRRVERCDCWRARISAAALAAADIPARYAACEFENFLTYPNEKLLKAVEVAKRFAENFPVVEKGLLFIGPPGIGKTHLAIAALKASIRATGARARYCDTRSLLTRIRSTYNPLTRTAEIDVIRPIMDAQLLVLDDLGAERLTDWVEETMNVIVNTRYNARLPTIFTSNYEDVRDREDMNSLLVRVGFRLHSRLSEMCEFLEYDGPDYRELPTNPDADLIYRLWKSQGKRRLPSKTAGVARAQLRESGIRDGRADLKWSGGKAGSGT